MCGLAFAGKSRLAAAIAARAGAVVVSLDDINERRGLAGGLGISVEDWAATHEAALAEAERALTRGESVVVDDTNCFRFLRDAYRRAAQPFGYPSRVLWLDVGLEESLRRATENRRRGRRPDVRDDLLADLAARFEPPAEDENPIVVPPTEDLDGWVRETLAGRPRLAQRGGPV